MKKKLNPLGRCLITKELECNSLGRCVKYGNVVLVPEINIKTFYLSFVCWRILQVLLINEV